MTTEEVIQIPGEPNSIYSREGKRLYTWSSIHMFKGSRIIRIDFKDNKVVEAPAVPNSFID